MTPIFTQIYFFQNDSEWLEMDFKHNFVQCGILTRDTPANVTFVTISFFEGIPNQFINHTCVKKMIYKYRVKSHEFTSTGLIATEEFKVKI